MAARAARARGRKFSFLLFAVCYLYYLLGTIGTPPYLLPDLPDLPSNSTLLPRLHLRGLSR